MSERLSYSQLTKYGQCPKSYYYHYKKKLRERSTTSALAFGSAIDEALNAVIKHWGKTKEVLPQYKEIFDSKWQKTEINKKPVDIIDSTLVGYSQKEFVEEILQEDDLKFIKVKTAELASDLKDLTLKELKEKLEGEKTVRSFRHFPENHHKLLNIINWLSLRRKGHLMLDAYIRDILPQIEEVKFVQKQIELEAENDTFIGYIDAVVRFKGRTDWTIMDNKTSSSLYDSSDVSESQQLALYSYVLDLNSAAYAVVLKNVKLNKVKICSSCVHDGTGSRAKTCDNIINDERCGANWNETVSPTVETQLFIDEISAEMKHLVVDNIGDICDAIKKEVFPQNLNACHNFYGSKCPYFDLCYKGKSDNLVQIE